MQIETSIQYHVGDESFDSESKARQWIADQVGCIVDKALSDAGKVIGPKAAIAVNDALIKNAKSISILLAAYAAPVSES